MDRERLGLWTICGRGLKARNVAAMAKLGLSVASNYVQVCSLGQVVGPLFLRRKLCDAVLEHQHMEQLRWDTWEGKEPTD